MNIFSLIINASAKLANNFEFAKSYMPHWLYFAKTNDCLALENWSLSLGIVPWIGALGIARKPAFLHASLLMEHLENAPEAREACDSQ